MQSFLHPTFLFFFFFVSFFFNFWLFFLFIIDLFSQRSKAALVSLTMLGRFVDILLCAVAFFFLLIAPYTKVEESFNIQGIHDIINYGIFPRQNVIENYDHIEFPGAVPRTFVGSLLIGTICRVLLYVCTLLKLENHLLVPTQLPLQTISRAIVGILNIWSLLEIKKSLNLLSGTSKESSRRRVRGIWFIALSLTQFHLLYYSTRTLPNFIALPLVNIAISYTLRGSYLGQVIFGFAGIVFRLEIGVFGTLVAFSSSILFRQTLAMLSLMSLAVGSIAGLIISLTVDSYFWGYLVIPELSAFKFNVIDGKATNWGVDPWSAYFTKFLPQLFRNPITFLLIVLGISFDPVCENRILDEKKKNRSHKSGESKDCRIEHPARNSLRILFVASMLYIFVMSFQPHKEWRFIIYIVPVFFCVASNGIAKLTAKKGITIFKRFIIFCNILSVVVGIILSLLMGYISSFNYPGGVALRSINKCIYDYPVNYHDTIKVYLDVSACMTGVSRFGEIHNDSRVLYDRTEDEVKLAQNWGNYDLLVTEAELSPDFNWQLIDSCQTFAGITINPILVIFKDFMSFIFESEKSIKLGNIFKESKRIGNLLDTCILRDDYLYIYENLGSTTSQLKYKSFLQAEREVQRRTEKYDAVHNDLNPSNLQKQINEEIDSLEASTIS